MTYTSELDRSPAGFRPTRLVATAPEAASTIAALEHAAWALAALVHVSNATDLASTAELALDGGDLGPARVLASLGLLTENATGFVPAPGLAALFTAVPAPPARPPITSTLRQIAARDRHRGEGRWRRMGGLRRRHPAALRDRRRRWPGRCWRPSPSTASPASPNDLATAAGSSMSAPASAPSVPPSPRPGPAPAVVGIDVLPRAVDLARQLVDERGLDRRFEVRQQGVEDLDDTESYDLAWLPAPFIPETVFAGPSPTSTGRSTPAAGSSWPPATSTATTPAPPSPDGRPLSPAEHRSPRATPAPCSSVPASPPCPRSPCLPAPRCSPADNDRGESGLRGHCDPLDDAFGRRAG